MEILYRVRSLHKCKLIMVCGNNQQLYSRLQKRYADKIELVGYTDKMPLYLKAGSIFITKPGGLSSTEAAAARIPLIHICPIPGCETKNMQFLKDRHGTGSHQSQRGADRGSSVITKTGKPQK